MKPTDCNETEIDSPRFTATSLDISLSSCLREKSTYRNGVIQRHFSHLALVSCLREDLADWKGETWKFCSLRNNKKKKEERKEKPMNEFRDETSPQMTSYNPVAATYCQLLTKYNISIHLWFHFKSMFVLLYFLIYKLINWLIYKSLISWRINRSCFSIFLSERWSIWINLYTNLVTMLSGKFALGLPVLSDLAGIKLKKIRRKFLPLARLTLTSFRNFPLYVSGETVRDK